VRSRKLPPLPTTSSPSHKESSSSDISQLIDTLREDNNRRKSSKYSSCSNAQSSPITLGDLLEVLDGIIETPGRMIVMTSNHPEEIDEALLRPGRIDINIEFKKMTRQDIKSMYELWFHEPFPQHVFAQMKDHIFTQAEVGNIFSTMSKKTIFSKLENRS